MKAYRKGEVLIAVISLLFIAGCTANPSVHMTEPSSQMIESRVESTPFEESIVSPVESNESTESKVTSFSPPFESEELTVTDILPVYEVPEASSLTSDSIDTAREENTGIASETDSLLSTTVEASNTNGDNNKAEEEIDLVAYVDEQIRAVTESDAYQDSETENRKELINQLLSRLKGERAINNFVYHTDSYLFSFEYHDGTLGGIKITDFDTLFN